MGEKRLELKIGSPVIAIDGNCGHIQHLIIDPHQERVVGLIVKNDPLSRHGVTVPFELVENSTESEVSLGLDCQKVFSLPRYKEGSPLPLQDQRYQIEKDSSVTRKSTGIEFLPAAGVGEPVMLEKPHFQEMQIPKAIDIRTGLNVLCEDGHVGRVNFILLDPSGKIKRLVVRADRKPHRDFLVPVEMIQVIDKDAVSLSLDQEAFDRLDEYVPDGELEDKIHHTIWDNNALWMTYYSDLHPTVKDGIITLRGYVPAASDKRIIENTVKSVAGVLGIEDRLAADYDLSIAVARALSRDEDTRLAMISVNTRKGIVSLSGQVEYASIQYAAEGIAASVPGVRGVINYIQAPGLSIDRAEERFIQPFIDREVYATDMLLGTVEKVMINPHNRRVMAILVHGNFPDPKNVDSSGWPREGAFQRRRMILPSRLIDYVTHASASLNIDSLEAAGYADYDAAQYTLPPDDWQPPYPYRRKDILFPLPQKVATSEQNFREMVAW
jgi:osmotically-inducible protein OsmY